MRNLIEEIQRNHVKILNTSLNEGIVQSQIKIFECDKLENYLNIDIRESSEFKSFFSDLKSMKGPVLYNFKVLSRHEHSKIRDKLIEYKKKPNSRASSALPKLTVRDSLYLYVGKVKKDISGRIITHLGYSKNRDTSGLQLFHWSRGLNLKLELSLIELIPEMADLLEPIELKIAQNYHPIIGQH